MTGTKFCLHARGTTYDKKSRVFRPKRCKMRSCKYCRLVRAHRIQLQAAEEGIFKYSIVQNFDTYRRRLKYRGVAYIGFPLPTGHVVMSILGEHLMLGDVVAQIVEWIEQSDPEKHISTSRGFGGKHAGCRPKPDENRYVHSNLDIGTILCDLKDSLNTKRQVEDAAIEKAEASSPDEPILLRVISEEEVAAVM